MPDGLYKSRYSRLYRVHYKKYEILTADSPIHIYVYRIYYRIVFKIKDRYRLKLQIPDTMKLFDGAKKLLDKIKNRENVSSLEVVEVVLVQCNLLDNQYQQKSGLYFCYTFATKSLMIIY